MSKICDGRVVLVTGAGRGIGRAHALELARHGARVVVNDLGAEPNGEGRSEGPAGEVVEAIRAFGGEAVANGDDVADWNGAKRLVETAITHFGRLDVVVNNAGVMLNGPTLEADVDDWEAMVDLNLKALMYVTRAALPHLVSAAADGPRGVADLVNISSIAGRFATRNVAIYNATKFGVTAASESWRQEFSPHRVRVSVVEPGVVETELFAHQKPSVQEHYERLFADVGPLRAGDLADVVAFIVTAPPRMAVAEVLVRPTDQA